MAEFKSPSRDEELFEKSVSLRVYSGALLQEAKELCKASAKLRKANATLVSDLSLIRSLGFFPTTNPEEAKKVLRRILR